MLEPISSISEKCSIFISYKRNGGEAFAYLIYDSLKQQGYNNVFLDNKKIIDEDYVDKIDRCIRNCTDFLVVFSPGCLNGIVNEKTEDIGTSREDWLAKELRIALDANAHIVPLIMENFRTPDGLPDDIIKAASQNGVKFPSGYFDEALTRLTDVFLNCSKKHDSMESDTQVIKMAENGDPRYLNDLGIKNEIGTPVIPQNKANALQFYIQAAKKGSKAAYCNIGDIYEKCAGDIQLAMSTEYDVDLIALVNGSDSFGSSTDISDAELRQQFLNAAEYCYTMAGDIPVALYRLGVLEEKKFNFSKAFSLYIKAAEKDYPPAVNAAAYYYKNALGNVPCQPEKAFELWSSIKDKLPHAAYNYAQMLEKEAVRDKLIEDIINYYEFAFFSRRCVPQAAFALGKIYEKQLIISKARHYYRLSFEAGYLLANKELRRLNREIRSSRTEEEGLYTDE